MTNTSANTAASRNATDSIAAIRNALSVDVEDYFHVSALANAISRESWDDMEYRVEANTNKLLQLFDEMGSKATFFVLGYVARRSPGLIREIHSQGHEVACHGLSHELIYKQSPAVFEEETRVSKQMLEDIVSRPVVGYRAASWSITAKSLWALDIIAELGFEYDSSIFPIHHDRYGIPGALQYPGFVESPGGRKLVEFPPSTVSLPGMRLPVAGGGYFRILPYQLTTFGLRRINRQAGQPFIFYLHPWEIDPDQPRFEASRLSRFRHYKNLDQTEPRLRKLLREFECTTARNVLADLDLLPV